MSKRRGRTVAQGLEFPVRAEPGAGEGGGGQEEATGKCRQAVIANFDSYVSPIYPRYIFRGLLRHELRDRNRVCTHFHA